MLGFPISQSIVTTHAIASDTEMIVFFKFTKILNFPLIRAVASGQWGKVVAGKLELTTEVKTMTYRPGDDYKVPSDAMHSVRLTAGTRAVDVFEESDRKGLIV